MDHSNGESTESSHRSNSNAVILVELLIKNNCKLKQYTKIE